jgi:hypothetical protein
LDLLANDWTIDRILDEYPPLQREDIIAGLKYAAEMVKEEEGISITLKLLTDENVSGKVFSLRSMGIDIVVTKKLSKQIVT